MKKIYNQPTCLVVQLGSRDALLQTVSASEGLGGTSSGGNTNEAGIGEGDVKGHTSINVWDEEW